MDPMTPFFTIPAPCRASVGPTLAARVARRDDYACVYCGRSLGALEVDHVTPCSYFPADTAAAVVNDPANLVTACEHCNSVKGSQDLDAFARMLRGRGIAPKIITAMVRRARAATRRPLPPLPDP
jgi:5-methylcytosine-specific restriction endonuclease McrA